MTQWRHDLPIFSQEGDEMAKKYAVPAGHVIVDGCLVPKEWPAPCLNCSLYTPTRNNDLRCEVYCKYSTFNPTKKPVIDLE